MFGFFIGLNQKDIRYRRGVVRIVDGNVLGEGIRHLLGVVKILHSDLHGIFAVGKRKALLVDEGAADVDGIFDHGAVEGHFGEVTDFVALSENGLYFDCGFELSGGELLVDYGGAVEGDGILDEWIVTWHAIGRGGEIALNGFVFGDACEGEGEAEQGDENLFHGNDIDGAKVNKKNFFWSKSLYECKKLYFCSGDMAEWSIAAVLKTVKPKGFGGSNPSVSAA